MSRELIAPRHGQSCLAVMSLLLMAASSFADDSTTDRTELGRSARSDVMLGGDTTGNLLGYGVIGRYYLNDGWFTGAALDAYEYDAANDLLADSLNSDTSDIDALASNTVLSGFVGRLYGEEEGRFDWFWSAGVGVGFPEFNSLGYGGESTFAWSFEAGTEIHLVGSIGSSYRFTPTWSATFAARLEHHFIDVTATDSHSGVSNSFESKSPLGAYISIDYRF